jgi:predicted nucleic acid-binding protein
LRIAGAIPDASPLIYLFRSQYDWILPLLYTEVVVPGAVWREVLVGSDEAARRLPAVDWAQHETTAVVPRVAAFDLGAGESEVLSIGLSRPEYHAVLDDAAGRRSAHALGIPFIGTGGLLLLAKKQRLIPAVGEALGELIDAGLWLTPGVRRLLLHRAGEDE